VALARADRWRHCERTSWLGDAPVHPLQQAADRSEKSIPELSGRQSGTPVFKKKGKHDAFRYPDPLQIELDENGAKIFLPKLGG
jgi:putative transposase